MTNQLKMLTAPEVASRLGVSDALIYQLAQRGEIASVRISSGSIRFYEADVNAYLASRRTEATPQEGVINMRSLESGKWYRAASDTILVVGHIEGNNKVTTIYHCWAGLELVEYIGRFEAELGGSAWKEIPNPGGEFTVPETPKDDVHPITPPLC